MGKKYVSVATKRLRAVANSKNLEFLTNAAQQEGKNILPTEVQPAVNREARSKNTRLLKSSVKIPKKSIESENASSATVEDLIDDDLIVPMKIQPIGKRQAVNTRLSGTNKKIKIKSSTPPVPSKFTAPSSVCSNETQLSVLGALNLHKVSPVKHNQVLDIQMEFFRDWEEPEMFDYNKPGPSTCSEAAQIPTSKEMETSKPQELSADRNIKRTYLAKRTGNGNASRKQTLDEILLPDDLEKEEIQDTQSVKTNECHCGQQPTIDKLQRDNAMKQKQIKRLKQAYLEATNRCLKLTDTLNSKVLGNPHNDIFTEVEGYPSREQLIAFSDQAIKSDYTFVRLLMEELWPTGYVNRSVSGRSSNNPLGRPRVAGNNSSAQLPAHSVKRVPLEPEKVKFVRDRLLEHRIYRGDPPAVAKTLANEVPSLMKRVLAYYGKSSLENDC